MWVGAQLSPPLRNQVVSTPDVLHMIKLPGSCLHTFWHDIPMSLFNIFFLVVINMLASGFLSQSCRDTYNAAVLGIISV